MYEDLIKRLRTHNGWALNKTLDEAANVIESVSKIYQMIAEVYESEVAKQKWIPVTEQLPEVERKSYWVCTNTGYQCECRWTNNQFGIGESDEWGWSIFDIPQYQKVIAWMDLPFYRCTIHMMVEVRPFHYNMIIRDLIKAP